MRGSNQYRSLRALLFALGATMAIGVTGCQSDVGGQTLPSPYYMQDDVQVLPARAANEATTGSGRAKRLITRKRLSASPRLAEEQQITAERRFPRFQASQT